MTAILICIESFSALFQGSINIMLQAINDRIKGWLGIAVVVLIGLPFALWGIESYISDDKQLYAAKVNGVEISANTFEESVSYQRQKLLRENDGKLPLEEKELRERTLSQLIDQQLLENVTFDNGYRVSDNVVAEKIKQTFSVDGNFDRARFESLVSSLGMSVASYKEAIRNELRLQQFRSGIVNTSFVTKKDIEILALLNEQTRDVSVLTFNVDHFSTAAKATQEDIKKYYEENIQQFMLPEKIKVDYVEITSDSLSENVAIDEVEIKKMYDNYVSSVAGREERNAQHILLQSAENSLAKIAKLEAIKLEISDGVEFSELAKKYSQDTGSVNDGGSLGWIALGDMTEPFEKVLFDLDKGGVSEIVKTQFGYHVIKLNDIRSETIAPIGVKRYEFEDELKADTVASRFYDLSERLASIAYENPDNLDVVVEELELKVVSSDFFSRVKGDGIAASEKIRNIAFSALVLEQGSNSDVIEVSEAHVAVIRLNEHRSPVAQPIELVSSKIENILKLQNGREQTETAALAVKAKLESGANIETLMTDGISMEDIKGLGREDHSKAKFPSILRGAFDLELNKDGSSSYKLVNLFSGDLALLMLTKVNTVENIALPKINSVKQDALRDNVIREYSNTLVSIKAKADIERNSRIIER